MNEPGQELVAAALREKTGLKLDPVIGPDLASAARRAATRLGLASLAALADRLRADDGLDDEFAADLTVGETYFFRDPPHFDFVHRVLFPARRAAGREGPLRIWSAGCSTGEEAWSLAMLCHQAHEPCEVLATDLSVKALAQGRAGLYRAWSVDRSADPLVAKWLHHAEPFYRVDDALRPLVRFEYLNLASDTYPQVATGTSGLDLIFCRNVLIYLDASTIERVYRKLFDALAIGGCLVCGPSDPAPPAHLPFRRLETGRGQAYQRAAPAPQRLTPRTAAPQKAEAVKPVAPPIPEDFAHAERAYAAGAWAQAALALSTLSDEPQVASLHARALCNLGQHALALERVSRALGHHPESIELRFLTASLLLDSGQLAGAAREFERVLYLDPSLAMAHFTLALTLHQLGRHGDAARAYRTTERLASRRPAEEVVPLSDGQGAGRLAHSSRAQLKLLVAGP